MINITKKVLDIIDLRRKERGLKRGELRELLVKTNPKASAFSQYFNLHTSMPLDVYLEICVVLDLNPFPVGNEILKIYENVKSKDV